MRGIINFVSLYWIAITAVLLTSITVLSLTPLEKLPTVPGSDKFHHLVAYAALTIPLTLKKPKYWRLIVIFFLVYSGLIETIQPHVNRYGEWLDIAANSLGIALGFLFAKLFSYFVPVKFKLSN